VGLWVEILYVPVFLDSWFFVVNENFGLKWKKWVLWGGFVGCISEGKMILEREREREREGWGLWVLRERKRDLGLGLGVGVAVAAMGDGEI
jgi:hypothetical protein